MTRAAKDWPTGTAPCPTRDVMAIVLANGDLGQGHRTWITFAVSIFGKMKPLIGLSLTLRFSASLSRELAVIFLGVKVLWGGR